MSLIRFKNSTEDNNIEVVLSTDSSDRIKITFLNETEIPIESTLLSGFVELNEHNFIEQSDFSDMNYLYLKINKSTYVLTKNKDDVYVQPEIPDSYYPNRVPTEYTPTVDDVRTNMLKEALLIATVTPSIFRYDFCPGTEGKDLYITDLEFSKMDGYPSDIKKIVMAAVYSNYSATDNGYYHAFTIISDQKVSVIGNNVPYVISIKILYM